MAPHATDSTNGSRSNGTCADGHSNAAAGMASKLKRYPETGISVLVVGSGIGGLMTALECWRKGLSVKILERSAGPVYTGELQATMDGNFYLHIALHVDFEMLMPNRQATI